MDCSNAKLRNDSGPALDCERLQVDQGVYLRDGFEATGIGARVVMDLTNCRIGGVLEFDPARLEHTASRRRLDVDGLVYNGLPKQISTREWLRLIRDATRPSPTSNWPPHTVPPDMTAKLGAS